MRSPTRTVAGVLAAIVGLLAIPRAAVAVSPPATLIYPPNAGQSLYTRVGTRISGAWQYTDSTFTAAEVQSVLTYPTNGSVADFSLPIEWSAVPSAKAYVLYLGSTVGASDILNTNEVEQTWYKLFKFPIGPPIHARLFTHVGDTWRYVDSEFTARPMTYTIAGVIYPREAGAGATVLLSGAVARLTVADSNGRYAFDGLAPDAYTVKVSAAGISFIPASWTGNVLSGDILDVNFTSSPPTSGRANAYDSEWKAAWVAHARTLLATATGKTPGFVLQIGDSISHEHWNAVWPRQGFGKTADDARVTSWARAQEWGSGAGDAGSKNGWYLAAAELSEHRGLTAAGGERASTLLSGCCVAGLDMPAITDPATARRVIADPAYDANLQIDTLIAAFNDAQVAVLMVGTNDPGDAHALSNLTAIVDKLEAQHILPVLMTIPPRLDPYANLLVTRYNAVVTALARSRSLPLIAFYEELTLRRPGNSWLSTLMTSDGVHPTSAGGGYTADSNPYRNDGSGTTGDALLNVGYLLRSWLTVQKLVEIKSAVVDAVAPAPNP